jgi:lactose/L-arabinose transport system ATP-binding protein
MLYVTHDQVEAMTLADKIVVMRDGIIEQIGSPVTLYDDPDNAFVAGFIGSPRINLLGGTVKRHLLSGVEVKLASDGGRLAVALAGQRPAIGQTVTAGIRPENVELVDASEEAAIPLRVDSVETLGSTTLVHLKSGEEPVSVEVRARLRLRPDEAVRARIRPDQVLLFDGEGKRVR